MAHNIMRHHKRAAGTRMHRHMLRFQPKHIAQQGGRYDLLRSAIRLYPPVTQHNNPVGHAGSPVEIMQHHQACTTLAGMRTRHVQHQPLPGQIMRGYGLIEQKQAITRRRTQLHQHPGIMGTLALPPPKGW